MVATRAFVYVAEADHGVKVGITKQGQLLDPAAARIAEIGRATGLPIELVRAWGCRTKSEAYQAEQAAHWLLRDTRTVGEWFQCHPFEAVAAVERALKYPGIYYESRGWVTA